MKNLLLFIVVFCNIFLLFSRDESSLILGGASFASFENGWFELGCENIGFHPINKAVGGSAICDMGNRMAAGTFYTKEELENSAALVIMHVHDRNVADTSQLKENYSDYQQPFNRDNYAIAFDYVIKKYMADCYNLKNDSASAYYNTPAGKPALIILCSHWHDARVQYNTSVRKLAEKWGFPLIEFDKYIGFSMSQPHPVTRQQISLNHAMDSETINDIKYGWHPQRGKDKYIQRKMAVIFADVIRRVVSE